MQNIVMYVAAPETLGTVVDSFNAKTVAAPTFVLGVEASLTIRLFATKNDTAQYPYSALSGVSAWNFVMDSDFVPDTACKIAAVPSEITVSNVTENSVAYTQFTIPLHNLASSDLVEWIGSAESKAGLNAELVGFDSSAKEIFILQIKNFTVRNRITSIHPPGPETIPASYYTQAQVDSLLASRYTRAQVDSLLAAFHPMVSSSFGIENVSSETLVLSGGIMLDSVRTHTGRLCKVADGELTFSGGTTFLDLTRIVSACSASAFDSAWAWDYFGTPFGTTSSGGSQTVISGSSFGDSDGVIMASGATVYQNCTFGGTSENAGIILTSGASAVSCTATGSAGIGVSSGGVVSLCVASGGGMIGAGNGGTISSCTFIDGGMMAVNGSGAVADSCIMSSGANWLVGENGGTITNIWFDPAGSDTWTIPLPASSAECPVTYAEGSYIPGANQ